MDVKSCLMINCVVCPKSYLYFGQNVNSLQATQLWPQVFKPVDTDVD